MATVHRCGGDKRTSLASELLLAKTEMHLDITRIVSLLPKQCVEFVLVEAARRAGETSFPLIIVGDRWLFFAFVVY